MRASETVLSSLSSRLDALTSLTFSHALSLFLISQRSSPHVVPNNKDHEYTCIASPAFKQYMPDSLLLPFIEAFIHQTKSVQQASGLLTAKKYKRAAARSNRLAELNLQLEERNRLVRIRTDDWNSRHQQITATLFTGSISMDEAQSQIAQLGVQPPTETEQILVELPADEEQDEEEEAEEEERSRPRATLAEMLASVYISTL